MLDDFHLKINCSDLLVQQYINSQSKISKGQPMNEMPFVVTILLLG
jgi:hypothetical protein